MGLLNVHVPYRVNIWNILCLPQLSDDGSAAGSWNFPNSVQRRYNYEQGHLEMSHMKGIVYIIGSFSVLQSFASLGSFPTRLPRQTESSLLWVPGLLSQGNLAHSFLLNREKYNLHFINRHILTEEMKTPIDMSCRPVIINETHTLKHTLREDMTNLVLWVSSTSQP